MRGTQEEVKYVELGNSSPWEKVTKTLTFFSAAIFFPIYYSPRDIMPTLDLIISSSPPLVADKSLTFAIENKIGFTHSLTALFNILPQIEVHFHRHMLCPPIHGLWYRNPLCTCTCMWNAVANANITHTHHPPPTPTYIHGKTRQHQCTTYHTRYSTLHTTRSIIHQDQVRPKLEILRLLFLVDFFLSFSFPGWHRWKFSARAELAARIRETEQTDITVYKWGT